MGITVDKCVCCGSSELASNPALWMPFIADRALGLPPLVITKEMGLRTIKDGVAYAMCKTLHCRSCGHLFVDYRFNENEMTKLYNDYRGLAYSTDRSKYEPGYQVQNTALSERNSYIDVVEEFLSEFLPKGEISILDWGGDTGKNTPFSTRASVIHIYDPSNKSVELDGASNIYETKHFLSSYQLVVLANVLEHIPFPENTLKDLLDHMARETILYLEVPYEGIQASASQDPPYSLQTQRVHWHEHINLFSSLSLRRILERCGLRILKLSSAQINTGNSGVSFTSILQVACSLPASI
jgi:hypothetical protein